MIGDIAFEVLERQTVESAAVVPNAGSIAGGTEITIHHDAFASFGPFNRILVGGIPCIPKTMRNHACKPYPTDPGYDCRQLLADDTDDVATRDNAQWIDFSTSKKSFARLVTSIQPHARLLRHSDLAHHACTIHQRLVFAPLFGNGEKGGCLQTWRGVR